MDRDKNEWIESDSDVQMKVLMLCRKVLIS